MYQRNHKVKKLNISYNSTIAITIFNNQISSRFDYAENVLIAKIENGKIIKQDHLFWGKIDPFARINQLNELGVGVLICGGITNLCLEKLKNSNIQVIPWIYGDVDKVLRNYLKGSFGGII